MYAVRHIPRVHSLCIRSATYTMHSKVLQQHSKVLQQHSKVLQQHSKVLQHVSGLGLQAMCFVVLCPVSWWARVRMLCRVSALGECMCI